MELHDSHSIIVLDKFIQATRDSGYKGTTSAIAELVDNSLQAGATRISIVLDKEDDADWPIAVAVLDNGSGMDVATLRQALRFGGTSRFNDRDGLGRYGMGLPNASLSQARRVEVYSWQGTQSPRFCYLDVDEIVGGTQVSVPNPRPRQVPDRHCARRTSSGTLVLWKKCDRLDHRRIATVARKVGEALGRIFRFFLWNGVQIRVNGDPIEPIDPLYIRTPSRWTGAVLAQDPLEFEIRAPNANGSSPTGLVTVTFSELPVEKWHRLPNDEKRSVGITNGAGISVIRGGREIDFGWFFMGSKRRENYDDWWRCEIRFDPVLDEAFGITHTKQEIHPHDYLVEILAPELETIAKALNARVRRSHLELKTSTFTKEVERRASARDHKLTPVGRIRDADAQRAALKELAKRHPVLREPVDPASKMEYRIVEDHLGDAAFFQPLIEDGRIVVVVNPKHPFHRHAYGPLLEDETPASRQFAATLQALLLAAARAESVAKSSRERETFARYRRAWSDALAIFLRE